MTSASVGPTFGAFMYVYGSLCQVKSTNLVTLLRIGASSYSFSLQGRDAISAIFSDEMELFMKKSAGAIFQAHSIEPFEKICKQKNRNFEPLAKILWKGRAFLCLEFFVG